MTVLSEIGLLLDKVKKIHFIGIGGAGMCPLAEILHDKGYKITGSDNNESETLSRIRALGIPVVLGQKSENIIGAEMIVFTAALLDDNPELCAAKASGTPTFERAKLFGEISRRYKNCIGISGTHGKTTVSAMLTEIFIGAELSPSAVIGGKLPLTGTNGIVGNGEILVCEACEFVDTFLELYPDVSVILNIDSDHLDYFKTVDNLVLSFSKFANMATRCVIYNGDDAHTLTAVAGIKNKKMLSFGLDESNNCYANNIKMHKAFPEFDCYYNNSLLGTVKLNVPGMHNVYNALAAILSALETGADFEHCQRALEVFSGAGRRFEVLGCFKGITIADDYAHHPKELTVTLEAAMLMEYKRVWAVFQPFTFSRTSMLLNDFATALKIPTKVVLSEVMGSREVNTYHVYSSQLAEKIPGSVWFKTFEEVADYVVDNAEEGDLVITLGCGDIYKAAKMMITKLTSA
ncbi:MAG: UDP-N-acetylmuramate--L-alanine ligase [Clostridiales bacterium]|nr:UDP-N-acetylmuramate--L-alanine ligase [Clostridiales bacterium]